MCANTQRVRTCAPTVTGVRRVGHVAAAASASAAMPLIARKASHVVVIGSKTSAQPLLHCAGHPCVHGELSSQQASRTRCEYSMNSAISVQGSPAGTVGVGGGDADGDGGLVGTAGSGTTISGPSQAASPYSPACVSPSFASKRTGRPSHNRPVQNGVLCRLNSKRTAVTASSCNSTSASAVTVHVPYGEYLT